jgi:hypothetical protein
VIELFKKIAGGDPLPELNPQSKTPRDTGHEKKLKNHQNCKFGLNEIK